MMIHKIFAGLAVLLGLALNVEAFEREKLEVSKTQSSRKQIDKDPKSMRGFRASIIDDGIASLCPRGLRILYPAFVLQCSSI